MDPGTGRHDNRSLREPRGQDIRAVADYRLLHLFSDSLSDGVPRKNKTIYKSCKCLHSGDVSAALCGDCTLAEPLSRLPVRWLRFKQWRNQIARRWRACRCLVP